MARAKAPCGTDAAYRRHLRNGELIDDACRLAHTKAGRASRRSPAASTHESAPSAPPADVDDMQLIVDTLRNVFVKIAKDDPTKLAPISREFRSAVEAVRGPVEPPKEMTLAEQLAEARAARAARAAG